MYARMGRASTAQRGPILSWETLSNGWGPKSGERSGATLLRAQCNGSVGWVSGRVDHAGTRSDLWRASGERDRGTTPEGREATSHNGLRPPRGFGMVRS